MTTIAWRNGTLAADSRVSHDRAHLGAEVIFKVVGDVDHSRFALAMTGEPGEAWPLMDWLLDRLQETPAKSLEHIARLDARPRAGDQSRVIAFAAEADGISGLVFEGTGFFPIVSDHEHNYAAWGSGAPIALGAMWAGKSAIEAVRAATAFDPYTGGEIVSFKVRHLPQG